MDSSSSMAMATTGYHKNTCVFPRNGSAAGTDNNQLNMKSKIILIPLYPRCVMYAYQIPAIAYRVFDSTQDKTESRISNGNKKY